MKDYDKASVDSIFSFSKQLTGKSIGQFAPPGAPELNSNHKGELGTLVEKWFFRHTPPNNTEPDFAEAGLELKTTGVVRHKSGYRAKERLKLTKLNFHTVVDESWETSTLVRKCRRMLILFYLYSGELKTLDRPFILPPLLYNLLGDDGPTIRNDWLAIRAKVLQGKAHEISESDTYYLGAARSGQGGSKERKVDQPFSDEKAWARALVFKQSYVSSLVANHGSSLTAMGVKDALTFEGLVAERFRPYFGKSVRQIREEVMSENLSNKIKNLNSLLAKRILADTDGEILELTKANVVVKTVTLNHRGTPKESMSFPAMNFRKVAHETWEESDLFETFETKKFLFVVFAKDQAGIEKLLKVGFWNMPHSDFQELGIVWQNTKDAINADRPVFPQSGENPVGHVRPHAARASDVMDFPSGRKVTKQSFWLNAKYLKTVIANLPEF